MNTKRLKKTAFIIISSAIILCITLMTGCVSVSYEWGNMNGKGSVVGKGDIVTLNVPAERFTKATIRINSTLNLVADDSVNYTPGEIKIELYESFAEYLKVDVVDGHLTIEGEKNFRTGWRGNGLPRVYLPASMIEELNVEGTVEFGETDTVTTESLSLNFSGVSSNSTFNLDVKYLSIVISGVGDLTLKGKADKAVIHSSGVGDLDGFGLVTKEADVEVSGVGSVKIYCTENLNARISGVGDIKYKGNPEVIKDKSGLGSIKAAN